MSKEDMKVEIKKFVGTYFGYWKMQIKGYLYLKRLSSFIRIEAGKPE